MTPKLQAVSSVKIETAVTAFQLQMKSIKKFETLIVQIPHPYMKTENNTVMCQYEGETLNGQPEGLGKISYLHKKDKKDLYSFVGVAEFKDRKMNGNAFLIGGVRYLRIGEMKDGLRNGYSQIYRPNGTLSYEGNFKNTLRHGIGLYHKTSGHRYIGDFDRDCMKEVTFFSKTGQQFRLKYDVEKDLSNFKDHTTQVPVSEEQLTL